MISYITCINKLLYIISNTKKKIENMEGETSHPGKDKPVTRNSKLQTFQKIFEVESDLNQTSDFAGGCTPYKKVAKLAEKRAEQFKKPRELRRKLKRKVPSESSSASTNASESFDKKSREKDEAEKDPPSKVPEKEETECSVELGSRNADVEAGHECATCKETVAKGDYIQHVRMCLQQYKYKLKKTLHEHEKKDAQEFKSSKQLYLCQICQSDISKLDTKARNSHVNNCIDGGNAPTSETATREQHQDKSETRGQNQETPNASLICETCNKDISNLNKTRQLQHVTRCADKGEEEVAQQVLMKAALEKARNKVLDCPLCGQKLKTSNSRKAHIKKCGIQFEIPLALVLERVREQEEEWGRKVDAGDIDLEVVPSAGRSRQSRSRRGRGASAGGRKQRANVDEATQLAIALSTSLAEEQKRRQDSFGDLIPQAEVIQQPGQEGKDNSKVDAFSILMTPTKPKQSTKSKKKKRLHEVPVLLRRSDAEAERKLMERMEAVLLAQGLSSSGLSISSTPKMKDSRLKGRNNLTDQCWLWKQSSLSSPSQDRLLFYVDHLMPPIVPCSVAVGSKIKSLCAIPGRGPDDSVLEPAAPRRKSIDGRINETLVASTQTAVMLAELAGDESKTMLSDTLQTSVLGQDVTQSCAELSQTTKVPEAEASGFIIQDEPAELPTSESPETVLASFAKMIDNDLASDLDIRVRQGSVVHCHKFMLASRCPLLYQEVNACSDFDLSEYSRDAVLALVKYIYIGDYKVAPDVMAECRALAQRWQLRELVRACGHQRKSDIEEEEEKVIDVSCADRDLNDLLRDVWGSDSEDQTDEDETEENCDEEERKEEAEEERDEEEMEELYEFMASQRKASFTKGREYESSCEKESPYAVTSGDKSRQLNQSSLKLCQSPAEKLTQLYDKDILQKLALNEYDSRSQEACRELILCDEDVKSATEEEESDSEKEDITEEDGGVEPLLEEISEGNNISAESTPSLDYRQITSQNMVISSDQTNMTSQRKGSIFYESPVPKNVSFLKESTTGSVSSTTGSVGSSGNTVYFTPQAKMGSYKQDAEVTPDLFTSQPDAGEQPEHGLDVSVFSSFSEEGCTVTGDTSFIKRSQRQEGDRIDQTSDKECDIAERSSQSSSTKLFDSDSEEERDETCCKVDIAESNMVDTGTAEKSLDSPGSSSCDISVIEMVENNNSLTRSPVFGSQLKGKRLNTANSILDLTVKEEDDENSPPSGDELGVGILGSQSPSDSQELSLAIEQSTETSSQDEEDTQTELTNNRDIQECETPRSSKLEMKTQKRKRGSHTDSVSSLTALSQCKKRKMVDDNLTASPVFTGKHFREDTGDDHKRESGTDPDMEEECQGGIREKCEESIDLTIDGGEEDLGHENETGSRPQQETEDIPQGGNIPSPVEISFDGGVAEVWDDFDDMAGYEEQFSQLNQMENVNKEETTKSTLDASLDGSEHSPAGQRSQGGQIRSGVDTLAVEYDPPTDMETDVSTMLDDSILWSKENEPNPTVGNQKGSLIGAQCETPAASRIKKPHKEWVAPSPFSPMPTYEGMVTPDLKKECQKIGIRAMPKKKMLAVLKSTYHSTHKYETDSEFEKSLLATPSSVAVSTLSASQPSMSNHTSKNQGKGQSRNYAKGQRGKGKARGQKVPPQTQDLSFSDESSSGEDSSEDSQREGCPEETVIAESDSSSPASSPVKGQATRRSKKSKEEKEEDKKEKVEKYIRFNPDLYLKILHYEPLEFGEFQQELKDNSISIGANLLKEYLDEQNILFSMRKVNKAGNRSPRKRRPRGRGRGGAR